MKTWNDLTVTLKSELDQWFVRQCRNIHGDYYLYFIETTPAHDGGIIICDERPANPEYRLAWPQRINKGATVEQNYRCLLEVCRRLPVLSTG
jgi:hypothetical protein